MLSSHIHRPSLERFALSKFNTLCDVSISEDTLNIFVVQHSVVKISLNLHDNPEVFEHKVTIDGPGQPWFNRAGCGKESRAYAENHGQLCLVSAEVETKTSSCRKFTSFRDNQSFIDYMGDTNERHLFECIRPGTPCMLFTDHDLKGGLDFIRAHQEGVQDIQLLFDLLGLPPQQPVVLTSHRTKTIGDYLSTHLRFPSVSLESCNGTLKAIHHLLKHTGRDFGGLDYGTHGSFQQLRVPGCSKAGSSTRLLPADGSPLTDIGSLLVGNSPKRAVHITTEMVVAALQTKFGCSNNCGLKHEQIVIPSEEIDHVTRQIHCLYKSKTGKDPSSIRYQHGSLWHLDHSDKCIHSETHKSNHMYITVGNRAVFCQCLGRCRHDREPVLLGYLHKKLSIESYPWEKSAWSCYQGTLAVDTVKHMTPGFDLVKIGKLLACIGDFKDLLCAYAGYDATREWGIAVAALTASEKITKPREALTKLARYISDEGSKKKRRSELPEERGEFSYQFDFVRFQHEHPHPLTINAHTVSSQTVHTRALVYEELDMTHRINLLHSEMMTAKTSVVIVKELMSLPAHARVICLTPRRLFAESLRGILKRYGLDFGHYHDEGFFKTQPQLVIIEVESLWKIKYYNFRPFDYVLIDESETTITQMLCVETHRHNIKNNWEVLVWLMERASKVLMADARMSMISMGFAQDHCSRRDIHYIRNTFQIPMEAMLFLDSKNMEKWLTRSVERGESLYTFSGGRNHAIKLRGMTQEVFGADKSVIYSSLNSGTEKVRAELANVNDAWKDVKAIHTTPSITVGTSFDLPDVIHNIFLFPHSMTASPNDCSQSSRRVRRPINPVLHYTVMGSCKKVPITISGIKSVLSAKSDLMLLMESSRVEKDFEDAMNADQLKLARALINDPGEKSTLIKTALRVILQRNLQLTNYAEELMRVFLESGHTITVNRGTASKEDCIPNAAMPEETVFNQHSSTAGVMAFYEEHEEELVVKEKAETLSPDERALLKLVHYFKNFNPDKWALVSYDYWLDYKPKLAKDKRLQLVLSGQLDQAISDMDRTHRIEIAHAAGIDGSILHSVLIPEVARVNFRAFAKPLITLFKLLGLSTPEFVTDSITIKRHSAALEDNLRECRTLLGPSGWSGQDLHENPTFTQLLQFLTNMLNVLVDGTFTRDNDRPARRVATQTTIETADKRTQSGKTTRKKRERITNYKLTFVAPNPQSPLMLHSLSYSALQRIEHLSPRIDE